MDYSRQMTTLLAGVLFTIGCSKSGRTVSSNFYEEVKPEQKGITEKKDGSVETEDKDIQQDVGWDEEALDILGGISIIGQPCTDEKDCPGGYCIEGPEGKVCTTTCIEDCPAGWYCKGTSLYGSDWQFICVPMYWDLCNPCNSDEECGQETDRCLLFEDEGFFCGSACISDQDCPAGYSCQLTKTALEGIEVKQCFPNTQTCLCKKSTQGMKKGCSLSNEYGTCVGEQVCLGAEGWSACDAQEPGPEVCNGVDDDCDGTVDETFPDTDKDSLADCIDEDDDNDGVPDDIDNCPLDYNPGQYDLDKDGQGNTCDSDDDGDDDPDEMDCAPLEPAAYHGADEVCDGVDNNCNGQVDEGYADFDLDGMANCVDPDDDNDDDIDETDCDPLNPNVYNGALEACDGLDNNCNGKIDEGFPDMDNDGIADCTDVDTDGDGDPDETDCAPLNPLVYNGAVEECDGIDNNCNGQVDEGFADTDLDGLANCQDPDDDNDGDNDAVDCAPLDSTINSKALELCDGIDNNCNGKIDEGFPDTDGDGESDCSDLDDDNDGDPDITDCNPLDASIHHGAEEVCDGYDNDCNGLVDESGATGCQVYYKDKDDDGFGMANKWLCLCEPEGDYTASQVGDCDDSDWAVHPGTTEICNGKDDDCDGVEDNEGALGCENYFVDLDGDGYGSGQGSCICWAQGDFSTKNGGDCDDTNPSIHPGMEEQCDGIDNNCNGEIDEGVGSTCGNCDPTCHQINVGPGGDEEFVLDEENSSSVSKDPDGNLQLDKEEVSLAFIWIANSAENTVSKISTETGKELGRYKICGNPSRTAVDLYGDVWVACRSDGGVAKIIVYEKNCPDKNNNGTIETSKDLNGDGKISGNEMLPKGQDECVKFIVYPGGSCQRAAGVDKENYGWIGEWYGKVLRRLDPESGTVVDSIGIPANPYGLVIDATGIIWVSGRGGTKLVRVDPKTKNVKTYASNIGCFNPYGITLDYKGRVWMGNCCCWHVAYRFDPATNTWAAANVHNRPRGIAGSTDGYVYVANDQSNQVAVVDADTMQTVKYINVGAFPVGMAVDFDGYIWAVNQNGSSATKIDPNNWNAVGTYPTGSGPYTYSDMTGYLLHSYTATQGYYQHVVPGGPAGDTHWTLLDVDVTTPGESNVKIRLKASNTVSGLAQTNWLGPFGPFPPNLFPMDLSAVGEIDGKKYLKVEIILLPDEDGNSPLLKGFSVQFHVPVQ